MTVSPSPTGLPAGIAGTPVALVGFQEDSAVFLLRGRADRVHNTRALADWIPAHPTGLVVVDIGKFTGAAHMSRDLLDSKGVIDGFNYSKGKFTYLAIVTQKYRAP